MKLIFIILSLSLFASCTSQKTIMDSWMGNNQHNLILSWGPPARTTSDGDNGQILIYANQFYYAQWNMTVYNYRMFYVDKDGKIYSWRTEHGQVPPEQMDVNLYVR